jgi:hypothetical protein
MCNSQKFYSILLRLVIALSLNVSTVFSVNFYDSDDYSIE